MAVELTSSRNKKNEKLVFILHKKIVTISVVVPVYNVAPYVERCIMSVMRQSYPAVECILVDDASQDDSIARCKRLINDYNGPTRFVILHHEKNRGLSAARNTGTYASTGDFLYYIDSDDEITPDCLEKMVEQVMRDFRFEMVMGDFRQDFAAMINRKNLKERECLSFLDNMPAELHGNDEVRRRFYQGKGSRPVYVWNKLLKTSFIKEHHLYNKEGLLWEDDLWFFYLLGCLNHVAFVQDVTYIYYRRPESIATSAKDSDRIKNYGVIHKDIADRIEPKLYKEEALHWVKCYCRFAIPAGDNPDYIYAYRVYWKKMKDAKIYSMVFVLMLTHYMSKSVIFRYLYYAAKWGWRKVYKKKNE